jgi:peroxiredoxin
VSAEPVGETDALRTRLGLTFLLVPDEDREIIKAYGLVEEGDGIALPATFVLDADRTVLFKFVSSDFTERPATTEILDALASS